LSLDDRQNQFTKQEIYTSIFDDKHRGWLSAKAKVKMTDNYGTQKATMYLRMSSDSVIWMVFKKLSIEAARVLIDHDSLYILNRLDKTYQQESIDSISNIYGFYPQLDFLESIMWGKLPTIDTSVYWEEKETDSSFDFRTMTDDIMLEFSYTKEDGQLKSGNFMDRYNLTGSWEYSDYRTVQSYKIPFVRKFHINFDANSYLDLEINFLEIDVGKAYELKFEIQDHYSRIRY
jgi:hypothetical protein